MRKVSFNPKIYVNVLFILVGLVDINNKEQMTEII